MIVAGIAAGVSAIGLAQAFAGWIVVARFIGRVVTARSSRPRAASAGAPVSVLKPLHGDEPLLEEALASTCGQDYATFQSVFGVSAASDTSLPAVERLRARFPEVDIAVVVDPTLHGENRKVGNLINMLPAAKYDVLVIADSDVHAMPDWLRLMVEALDEPQVGLVTAAYAGVAAHHRVAGDTARRRVSAVPAPPSLQDSGGLAGVVGSLGAVQINQYFLPGALLARAMGRQDCLGATMMLRRETLQRIGGFHALVDHLADDNVLGRLVQRLGLRPSPLPCGAMNFAGHARFAHWHRCHLQHPCCNTRSPGLPSRCCWQAARCGRWPGSHWPGRYGRSSRTESTRRWALPIARPSGFCRCASLCPWQSWPRAMPAAASVGAATHCKLRGSKPDDEDAVPASAVIRRVRRGRRFALPGATGDPQLLVSDLARTAGRAGAGQQADRRASRGRPPRRGHRPGTRFRAVRDPHLDAVLRLRRQGRGGAEGCEPGAEDWLRRRQGRGAAGRKPAPGCADRLRRTQRVRLHGEGDRRGPRSRSAHPGAGFR